jgi:7-cyano-7-deazaguanine reductase
LKLKNDSGIVKDMAKMKPSKHLTLLGRSETRVPQSPSEARLETFPNPSRSRYTINYETDDFTSLCPVTGQADFARIAIEYVPDAVCVESKSLKFYLASYRSERAFNEAITNRILHDFVKACAPHEAIVTAEFSARGGIALTVRAKYPDNEARPKRASVRNGR